MRSYRNSTDKLQYFSPDEKLKNTNEIEKIMLESEEDKKLRNYLDYINKDKTQIKQALAKTYKDAQERELLILSQ